VNSEQTNFYWNRSVQLIQRLYPSKPIVIIDDNSDYTYVKGDVEYTNVKVIQSEFTKRGELLPYCYYLKYKFFQNAVIVHDSVFFHRRIMFEKLIGEKVVPLWHFLSDQENIDNIRRISSYLKNNGVITSKFIPTSVPMMGLNMDKWIGCFGIQSFINLQFLEHLENKYHFTNLINVVHNRLDRCSLERIFGIMFSVENQKLLKKRPSIFGNIMKYQTWGYSINDYINDSKKKQLPVGVVKVWTGR
jgi:hypothetical protein